MFRLTKLVGRAILDSRGNPTVEADCYLEPNGFGRAAVPSGASTGKYEAVELRDGDPKAFHGQGVSLAVNHVNQEISAAVVGRSFTNQAELDQALNRLDGTNNKERLGANAILAVSLAALKAQANLNNQPLYQFINEQFAPDRPPLLPLPMINVLNGGAHAAGSSDIQEMMIIPVGAKSWPEALKMATEVFQTLKLLLHTTGQPTTVGDEGGFAPRLTSGNHQGLDLLCQAIRDSGYTPGRDIALGLDVAASQLLQGNRYVLPQDQTRFNVSEMVTWLKSLTKKYPIISLEDGLAETDLASWQELTATLGSSVQLVGDDLFVTNPKRLQACIKKGLANTILIKPNQIGSFSEMLAAVNIARQAGYGTIMSHRSGETEDTTIAHLAVGLGLGQIKTGSLSRGERTSKYNELTRINEQLGAKAKLNTKILPKK